MSFLQQFKCQRKYLLNFARRGKMQFYNFFLQINNLSFLLVLQLYLTKYQALFHLCKTRQSVQALLLYDKGQMQKQIIETDVAKIGTNYKLVTISLKVNEAL